MPYLRPDGSLDVAFELDGWQLFAAWLERQELLPGAEGKLAELRTDSTNVVRSRWSLETLAQDPVVAGLRQLFKACGTHPSRYRPSSEALIRRLLKGDEMPSISPLVDVNNCLSARLAVPCCVMAEGTFDGPFVFRRGGEGEQYESLRGPFRLEGRPLLVDAHGPCDAPITGSERVKVGEETPRALLVAYLPAADLSLDGASAELDGILEVVGPLVQRAPT